MTLQHEFTMSYFVDRLEVELARLGTSALPGHSARGVLDAVIHSVEHHSRLSDDDTDRRQIRGEKNPDRRIGFRRSADSVAERVAISNS